MVDRDISHIDGPGPTRRGLLAGGGALLAALSLPACDLLSTDPASKKKGNPAARQGKEAQDLADMVKAGRLPRLSERLPKNPLVVKPVDRMGVYGGEWNAVILGATDTAWPYMTAG